MEAAHQQLHALAEDARDGQQRGRHQKAVAAQSRGQADDGAHGASDDLEPEVGRQRTLGQQSHHLGASAAREALGEQVAAEEVQVHQHEGAEELGQAHHVVLLHLQVARATQPDDDGHHERRAAHQGGGHEPGSQKSGVPHLVPLLQAEDPGGHRVHEHGGDKGDHRNDAQRHGADLAALGLNLGPQVYARQDEVGGKDNDIPHERAAQIGVNEQLPHAEGLAHIHHYKTDGDHRAGDG